MSFLKNIETSLGSLGGLANSATRFWVRLLQMRITLIALPRLILAVRML
jgi:hypothetical protein